MIKRRCRVRLVSRLGSCVVVVIVGTLLLSFRPIGKQLTCPLVIDETAFDFGTVGWQHHFEWRVPVTNHTDKDMKIVRFRQSCNCVSVTPEPLVIPARSSEQLRLVFDLSRNAVERPRNSSRYGWDYSVSILADIRSVVDNSYNDRVRWRFHGEVRTNWIVSPAIIDFDDGPGTSAGAVRLAHVVCEHPVDDLSATCDPGFATVRLSSEDNEGLRYVLRVSLQPHLPAGHHVFEVNLNGTSPDGERLSGLPIWVRATTKGAAVAVPENVAFGVKSVGSVASADLVLRATDGVRFTLIEIRENSADVNVDQLDVGQDAERVFRVSQRISKLGQQSGTIVFSVLTPALLQVRDIIVHVSYFGVTGLDY